MDLKQLEALGITAEDLTNRIVDQAVDSLLNSTGFDPENEVETRYESRFIESADMKKTNAYGEAKGPAMTFKEYIASRAESYMSEDVDINGKNKVEAGDPYSWRSCGPRLTVLMRMYIRDSLETQAKAAVNDVNKVIAKNIAKAAVDAISAATANLKVVVAT